MTSCGFYSKGKLHPEYVTIFALATGFFCLGHVALAWAMAARVAVIAAPELAYPCLYHKKLDVSFPRVKGGGDATE
jgi:hypothetical protein